MKFLGFFLLVICSLSALLVMAEDPPKPIEDPKVNAHVGGSPGDGFNVGVDVRKNVWESDNGKHAVDLTGGYSQHLGGPYGNGPADHRAGAVYTYKW